MDNQKKFILAIIAALSFGFASQSMAASKTESAKCAMKNDKLDALASDVMRKIKDKKLTGEEKENLLDKLKKQIEKADGVIAKKRIEIQKIEEDIKPIETQKETLYAALDELISYTPPPPADDAVKKDGYKKKDAKKKKEKSKKK